MKIEETHLYQEIHQQPNTIEQLVTKSQNAVQDLAVQMKDRHINHVFIAARGSSDNAGRYANYLFGAHNQMVVSLATPSLFTIYKQPPNLSNTLVLGISQSGKSPDVVSVIQEGRRQGALTAAITNVPGSDLSNAAEFQLDLEAGDEISLAATKSYTAQLTLLALLSAALHPSSRLKDEIHQLPTFVEDVFQVENQAKILAERYRYMAHCTVIGRGYNYASAFELSLKLKELTYTIADPYSSADFLHGPVALVDRGFPVFIIAPDGKMNTEMIALVNKVRDRQAEVLSISNQLNLLSLADYALELPSDIPEWISPIPGIIPGQLLAMYLAKTRGIDIDNPRGLKKVTETW